MYISLRSLVLLVLFFIALPTHAQMMGMPAARTASLTASSSAVQEEAAGKLVWDKLQNKEVTCTELTDEDFDVLADFFMGNMMGGNHEAMNEMMAQRLGEEGEEQMHIAMGKRLSGCDTNATLPEGSEYFMPMMGMNTGMNYSDQLKRTSYMNDMRDFNGRGMMSHNSYGFFEPLISLAALIFLILGSMFFWNGIRRK